MRELFMKKLLSKAIASALLLSVMTVSGVAASSDPVVVVSLGDSYSSGEGLPEFYGQEKAWENKIYDEDWLAHRSRKSWPGMLEISGISGTLKDYNVKESDSSVCKWYFGAVSGAETVHFSKENQRKDTYKRYSLFKTLKTTSYLPKQMEIFNNINDEVDYVTLTVGGNDVGFVDLVTTCAVGSTYLHFGNDKLKLEKQIDSKWAEFNRIRANIKQVYTDIQSAAGSQANIIVAGYPKLLDKEGKGFLISEKEATIMNENVTRFNNSLLDIVNECRGQGMNIHFVDVEAEFDKDGGHQAYSDDAWINGIILFSESEDLDQSTIASAYSIHPNEEGVKAYARCVNAKIREIENNKNRRSNTLMKSSVSSDVIESEEAMAAEVYDIEDTTAVTEPVNVEDEEAAYLDNTNITTTANDDIQEVAEAVTEIAATVQEDNILNTIQNIFSFFWK